AAAVRARTTAIRYVPVVGGTVAPGARGARVRIQRRAGGRWVTVGRDRLDARGRYARRLGARGVYRVAYRGGVVGPAVRVR
ncbi:MAG TPA: hypothetical protein VLB47_08140, partial [Solirubrobacteraceae bacterium]|nr:hypothetical protein [Solirubrobacteraceae bacterium]